MLRWFGVLVVAAALALGACGKIVTLPPGTTSAGIPSGYMLVRFRTSAPMNFQKYQYLIVFNTSGTGGTPYANAVFTGSYQNFTFAFDVSGMTNALISCSPGSVCQSFLQYYTIPGGGPNSVKINEPFLPSGLVLLNPNDNGQGNEFSILFPRALFYLPSPASPTPGPSVGPSATPTLPPSGLPNPVPTTVAQQTWFVNFFTLDANSSPIDALGTTGISDTSFSQPLLTTSTFDVRIDKPTGADQVSDPAAFIVGGEFTNAP